MTDEELEKLATIFGIILSATITVSVLAAAVLVVAHFAIEYW